MIITPNTVLYTHYVDSTLWSTVLCTVLLYCQLYQLFVSILQQHTVLYHTVQYQCSTVLYSTNTVQYCTIVLWVTICDKLFCAPCQFCLRSDWYFYNVVLYNTPSGLRGSQHAQIHQLIDFQPACNKKVKKVKRGDFCYFVCFYSI